MINEINYNSSDGFDPEDWVEIYNSSSNTIDMGSWLLKDENYGIISPAYENFSNLQNIKNKSYRS